MGLDMTLYRKINVAGKSCCWRVTEQIAHWRKFNALHGWFVRNCNRGEYENEQLIKVTKSNLDDLLSTLKMVRMFMINNPDMKYRVLEESLRDIFPPTPGPLFGSYLIDKYYFQNIEYTILTIEKIIKENENSICEFYYGAFY